MSVTATSNSVGAGVDQHLLSSLAGVRDHVQATICKSWGCQDSQMQKEIQRVHVIVERLLEVNAVRADLTFSFRESNGEPFPLPTQRLGKIGTKGANEEERDRFSE